MSKRRGKILVISGPSGVGKTTLYRRVLDELKEKLVFSISATSRAPRADEKEGVDYFYFAKEEFQALIDKNAFLEWAEVHGNYYGTLRSTVEDSISNGKSVLLDLDVQGARSIRKAFPDAHFIFILPPSEKALHDRLEGRGSETPESLERRYNNAIAEMKFAGEYEYQIINNDRNIAYQELLYVVKHIIDE